MARLDPLPPEDLSEFVDQFAMVEAMMGFVPNSMPTMARVPGLLEAFGNLGVAVLGNGLIPMSLLQMVAHVTSTASGCRYCQAHTGHSAERLGVSTEKLRDLWRFETSNHFDAAERSALRLALHAGSTPNLVTDDDFADLHQHYDDNQIAALVAVISMFGFLNRWNDSLATGLEVSPSEFGGRVLKDNGWSAGKHGPS